MGNKKANEYQLQWQTVTPVPYNPNSTAATTPTGAMASTNTIYSQVIDLRNFDNSGLEISWTGTPTGTLTVNCSVSGQTFPSLTFSPALSQPSGAAGSYLINLNQLPYRFLFLQYVNISGSGAITAWIGAKDLN